MLDSVDWEGELLKCQGVDGMWEWFCSTIRSVEDKCVPLIKIRQKRQNTCGRQSSRTHKTKEQAIQKSPLRGFLRQQFQIKLPKRWKNYEKYIINRTIVCFNAIAIFNSSHEHQPFIFTSFVHLMN